MLCNCKLGFFRHIDHKQICINGSYQDCEVFECVNCKQLAYVTEEEIPNCYEDMVKKEEIDWSTAVSTTDMTEEDYASEVEADDTYDPIVGSATGRQRNAI